MRFLALLFYCGCLVSRMFRFSRQSRREDRSADLTYEERGCERSAGEPRKRTVPYNSYNYQPSDRRFLHAPSFPKRVLHRERKPFLSDDNYNDNSIRAKRKAREEEGSRPYRLQPCLTSGSKNSRSLPLKMAENNGIARGRRCSISSSRKKSRSVHSGRGGRVSAVDRTRRCKFSGRRENAKSSAVGGRRPGARARERERKVGEISV